jgi:hypothetical protein
MGLEIHIHDPGFPTRIVKGFFRDSLRRAKSFKRMRKKGQAGRDRPEIRSITITYSDSQDWRLRMEL